MLETTKPQRFLLFQMPFWSKKKVVHDPKTHHPDGKKKVQHKNELKFADEVFAKKDKKKLLLRYDAIANGRNHITKQDFLEQPEIGTNPLIERVVDVVLEENGHATRRHFEGNFIECDFGASERERFIGLHFDPIIGARIPRETINPKTMKMENRAMGCKIEEVVPGGVAALKGNLRSGMRLIAGE